MFCLTNKIENKKMLPALQVYFPGKLVFANGCFNNLIEEIDSEKIKSVFIATIEPLLTKVQSLQKSLEEKGIAVLVDTSIVQEPSFGDFDVLMNKVNPFQPDLVIGIGGGSVLDVAKLVAAQLYNEQELKDYVGIGLLKGRKTPLICLPATSGTGSEVSPNAILLDEQDNQKRESLVNTWCPILFM